MTQQLRIAFEPEMIRETEGEFSLASGSFEIRLQQKDCFQALDEMEPESVDVIITSPPYNLGISYNSYDDNKPRAEYLDWLAEWREKAFRVLSPEGSLFFNIGSKPSDPWVSLQAAAMLTETPGKD